MCLWDILLGVTRSSLVYKACEGVLEKVHYVGWMGNLMSIRQSINVSRELNCSLHGNMQTTMMRHYIVPFLGYA